MALNAVIDPTTPKWHQDLARRVLRPKAPTTIASFDSFSDLPAAVDYPASIAYAGGQSFISDGVIWNPIGFDGFRVPPSGKSTTDDSALIMATIADALAAGVNSVVAPDVGTPWIIDQIVPGAVNLEFRGGVKWKDSATGPAITISSGSLTICGEIDGNEANNAARITAKTPFIKTDHSTAPTIDLSRSTAVNVPSALVFTDEFSPDGSLFMPSLATDSSGKGQFVAICCKGWRVWGVNTRNVCNADGWVVRVGHFNTQDRSEDITDVKVIAPIIIGNDNGDSTSGSGILCELDAKDVEVVGPTLKKLYAPMKVESEASAPGCNVDGATFTDIDVEDMYATALTFSLKGSRVRITGKWRGQGIAELGDDAYWDVDSNGGGVSAEPVIKCRGLRPRVYGRIIDPLQDGVKTEAGADYAKIDVFVSGCTTDCVDLNAVKGRVSLEVEGSPAVGVRIRSGATSCKVDPDSYFDNATVAVSSAVTDTSSRYRPFATTTRTIDANGTVTGSQNGPYVKLAGTYTAPRTMTLNVTGSGEGDNFIFYFTGSGSSWNIGGLHTLPAGEWCEVVLNTGTWELVRHGTI